MIVNPNKAFRVCVTVSLNPKTLSHLYFCRVFLSVSNFQLSLQQFSVLRLLFLVRLKHKTKQFFVLEEYIATIGYMRIFCINIGPEALEALISESELCDDHADFTLMM